jgi:thiol:disulfide interchange protein DsbC
MIKKLLAATCAVLMATVAFAQDPEADIKKKVEAALGPNAKVDSVRKAGVLGLYEVVLGGEIIYTDDKAAYMVFGHLIDPKTRTDLTQDRLDKLAAIKFSDLPLELAVKQVRGNGKRVIATFEDPYCGACRTIAKEYAKLDNVTIYTFLLPIIHPPESTQTSKNIWCAKDRAKAWSDLMVKGIEPAEAKCDASAIDKTLELGARMKVNSAPTIYLSNGTRLRSALPVAQFDELLTRVALEKP